MADIKRLKARVLGTPIWQRLRTTCPGGEGSRLGPANGGDRASCGRIRRGLDINGPAWTCGESLQQIRNTPQKPWGM